MASANRKQSELEKGSLYDFIGHRLRTRPRCTLPIAIEVASVIELSEASGRVAAGLFMTEG